ncbi:MAG TPA: glycosyltransferase family 39 protein [Verrucomicrobiae bacterium]|jgi:4-amino-4-deoxy-L-arabinose transferase-like glycosyltransferase|nr:glycosyltransferase family 39 protein [Verrucomicrobiae bacterium]
MNLQDIIHYIEVGAGKRFTRFLLPCILVLGLALLYNFRVWKDFSAPEAMDSAQLARNIAHGKGYTTLFVRPLSVYLVQARNQGQGEASSIDQTPDYARLKAGHPDLANPPVYPVVLAGLMKIAPFHYAMNLTSAFWANNGLFARYQPDFIIGIFNQLLFLFAVVAAYFIAKRLFDTGIARLSAILMLTCDLLWRFSTSGLSTMLLMLDFLALFWCILKTEELAREEEPDTARIACWSAGAGILAGVGALTRYAFGWAIIPVILFLLLFSGPKKWLNTAAAFAAFAIALAPWIARNIAVSGTPFGTAGYAIFDGTGASAMPIERSLHPDLLEVLWPPIYWHKFAVNGLPIIQEGLLKIGGTWPSLLFFSGLLLAFNRPGARRMRYFLLMCLVTFIVVQALGRTSLSDVSPDINSENLLVLTAPFVIMFGTAFFFILLDQMSLPAVELRYVVIGIFVLLSSLPLLSALWYRSSPVSYPPYFPPDIARTAAWMKESELTMSDVPWAVAWYGDRQCVWLTEDAQDSFFELNDYMKPVNALYLTTQTMDGHLLTDCFRSGKGSWGNFVVNALAKEMIPPGFPLHHAPSGSAAVQSGMFLTDVDRWKLGQMNAMNEHP